jgi:APA family basic amino acid/polyamine antiporter
MPGQFARKASGLIRTASVWDAFGLNVMNGLLGIAIAWLLLYIPFLYRGANIYLITIIGLGVTVPFMMVFTKLGVVFPRSGGEYIYNSRLVHPALGFAGSVGFVGMMLFWVGAGGTYFVGYGLAPMFSTAGIQLHNSALTSAGTWLTGTWQLWIISVVEVAFFGALLIFGGMRAYFRFQTVAVILGTASLLVIIIYAFTASRHSAISNLSPVLSSMGVKNVAELAKGTTHGFSLWQTIKAQLWPWSYLPACFWAVYIGGEVKQPGRNLMRGAVWALVYMAAFSMIAVAAMYVLLGQPFFYNVAAAFNQSAFGIAGEPSFAQLTAGAMGNGYVTLVLMACFSLWGLMLSGAMLVFASRSMFAWSIDRITPGWFSRVHPRWHSPYNTIMVCMLVGVLFVTAYSLKWITPLYYNWACFLGYILVGVSAIVLPYRHSTLWHASPGANRFLGAPTIAIWGVLELIATAGIIALNFIDPNAGTSPITYFKQFIVWPIVVVGAFGFYYVSRSVRRRQGVDLSLNFREIPPE